MHGRDLTSASEITGQFGGFVFTAAGKRRMRLQEGDREWLLKVPRILRRRIIGKFPVGETFRVAVTDERDPETGVLKRVVSQVLPGSGNFAAALLPPMQSCVVRVCSKKNCWRNGGRELFEALGREVAANGQAANIEIRQVGCLDRCKQAPNADLGGRTYALCSPREAGAIVARAAGGLSCREVEKE